MNASKTNKRIKNRFSGIQPLHNGRFQATFCVKRKKSYGAMYIGRFSCQYEALLAKLICVELYKLEQDELSKMREQIEPSIRLHRHMPREDHKEKKRVQRLPTSLDYHGAGVKHSRRCG